MLNLLFLVSHILVNPFRNPSSNQIEFFSLLALTTLPLILLLLADHPNTLQLVSLYAFVLGVAAFIFAWLLYRTFKERKSKSKKKKALAVASNSTLTEGEETNASASAGEK